MIMSTEVDREAVMTIQNVKFFDHIDGDHPLNEAGNDLRRWLSDKNNWTHDDAHHQELQDYAEFNTETGHHRVSMTSWSRPEGWTTEQFIGSAVEQGGVVTEFEARHALKTIGIEDLVLVFVENDWFECFTPRFPAEENASQRVPELSSLTIKNIYAKFTRPGKAFKKGDDSIYEYAAYVVDDDVYAYNLYMNRPV
jgi:hypothetical protein